ncbi:acyltransferase family protein [Teichococcus aestuarii]|uniref:acyltransferase family protein n=1 Tax=Teichococcus aestuarii TaxID=568898 RepID=UPI003613D2E3
MTADRSCEPSKNERHHYLDYLRAILMFLGIPYHAALAFSSHQAWIVEAERDSALLSWAAQLSHTFRMPVFLLIAGFFAMMLCQRRPGSWWRSRLVRLGVPLAAATILINPLLMLGRALWQAEPSQVLDLWLSMLATPGEPWVSHLWFLIDLLIYSSILAVLLRLRWMPALARRADRVAGLMASRWWVAPGLLLFSGVAALGTVVALSVLGLNSTLHGMLVLARTSAHLPVFLCGAALALRRDWLDRFTRIHWWMWAAGLVLAAALAAVQWRDEDIYRAVTFFLMPVVGILFAHILMSGMRACFQGANRLVQIAVDSSFTVYLVHQVFIVFGVVLMMGSGIPVLLQFVLLVAASTILSLGFHQQLVRRRPVLRLLFNGVLPERAAPLAGAAAAPRAGRI